MPPKAAKKRAKKTVKAGALRKIRKGPPGSLTMEECCRLVWLHLERIAAWQKDLTDWLSPGGGGGTPPQPPPWPPK